MIKKIIEQETKRFFKQIGTIASYYVFLLLTLFFYAMGHKKLSLRLIVGFFIIEISITIIRFIYFKERPCKKPYSNIFEKINASSFPSGHSSRIVFLMLNLITLNNSLLFISFCIIVMFLVTFSRYYNQRHYILDILGGYILGFTVSAICFMIIL